MENYKKKLLSLYDMFPFEKHPLWKSILKGELSLEQVLKAETQHYLRTKRGKELRKRAMLQSQAEDAEVFELLVETYMEECEEDSSGPSHLDLIERLLVIGGIEKASLLKAKHTPGNIAAISLYRDIGERGFRCHMLGAGTVEYYYADLSSKIFAAYTQLYGMTDDQAHTYKLHGPMDKEHAERAFKIIPIAIEKHGWETIEESVRDAFVATSLHYDGMLQNALDNTSYWDGKS